MAKYYNNPFLIGITITHWQQDFGPPLFFIRCVQQRLVFVFWGKNLEFPSPINQSTKPSGPTFSTKPIRKYGLSGKGQNQRKRMSISYSTLPQRRSFDTSKTDGASV
jgi:hypothetical protein